MDLQGVRVYIPPHAEVRSVPLHCFSGSLRRKMGLSAGLDALPDAPPCVWICPVLFQQKQQRKEGPPGARQQMLDTLEGHRASFPTLTQGYGRCKLSFVAAHSTAYRLLKETLTLGVDRGVPSSHALPQGLLSDHQQDAVIIHQDRVYLSVKKGKRASGAHDPSDPNDPSDPSDPSAPNDPSARDVAPDVHKSCKRKPPSPCEAPEELQPKLSCGGTDPSQGSGVGDQEPAEEPEGRDPSLTPYSAGSWGPSELLARHSLGPSPPDIDFEELASREKIALMKAKLQQRGPVPIDL